MKAVTDLTINPEPCTPEDEKTNWQNIAHLVNNQLLGGGGDPPDPDPIGDDWIRFQLASALDPSSRTGQAIVLNESGGPALPPQVITVYDVENRYPEAPVGKKGYCVLFGDTPIYEIVILDVGLLDVPKDPPDPPPPPGEPPLPPVPPPGDFYVYTINEDGDVVITLLSELLENIEATEEDIRGLTFETIPGATGTRTSPRNPGVGQVQLYEKPTGPAGAAWNRGAIVTVENWMQTSIAPWKPCHLKRSRQDPQGNLIYSIHSEGCVEVQS